MSKSNDLEEQVLQLKIQLYEQKVASSTTLETAKSYINLALSCGHAVHTRQVLTHLLYILSNPVTPPVAQNDGK